jgi:hypothetical protein
MRSLDVITHRFRARVTRAGKPVRGTISLRSADASRTAKLDDDGQFAILLDGPGEFGVRIDEPDRTVTELVTPVKFDGDDRIEIELPPNAIRGMVVDEHDQPVAAATVSARLAQSNGAGARAYGHTDADGTFVIPSLTAGLWHVMAESADRATAAEVIAVEDDREHAALRLVLDRKTNVVIRITNNSTPVPAALVAVHRMNESELFPDPATIKRTDANGTATFPLHARDGEELNIAVISAEGTTFSVRRPSASTISIETPAITGRLTLRRNDGDWADRAARLIAEDGSSLGIRFGSHIAETNRALIFDRLPAGLYHYYEARTAAERALLAAGRFRSLTPLGTAVVRAGQAAEIVIPEANAPKP